MSTKAGWNYIHNTANAKEQDEITTILLQRIEARRNRRILVRGRLIANRRGLHQYHMIDADRRRRQPASIPWWWSFEVPAFRSTPFVVAASLLSMTVVLIIALYNANEMPEALAGIPIYGMLLMATLRYRHRRLLSAET